MSGYLVENPEYQIRNPEQIPRIEESIPDDRETFSLEIMEIAHLPLGMHVDKKCRCFENAQLLRFFTEWMTL